jgi:preprotein translocase subunit SecD
MEAAMENQLDQKPKGKKTNLSPKIIFVTVGGFALVCGLIALGIFYNLIRLASGPRSQIVLEPDYSLVSTVDPVDLETDAKILTDRSRALGTGVKFVVAENNEIIAQVPTSVISQNFVGKTTAIGLLEIVDFGETPISPGTTIATDFDYKYFPQMTGTKWHTIMTNAEFKSVYVEQDKLGNYQIPFTLTANGTKTLSDYTINNIDHYLGIVMDKVVISAPKVNSPITEGSGIIAGSFTQEQAESFAVYLHVKGPLPIPLKVKQVSDIGK